MEKLIEKNESENIEEEEMYIKQLEAIEFVYRNLQEIIDDESYAEIEYDDEYILGYNYNIYFEWDDNVNKTVMHLSCHVGMQIEYGCELASFLTALCYSSIPLAFKVIEPYFVTIENDVFYGWDAHDKEFEVIKANIESKYKQKLESN